MVDAGRLNVRVDWDGAAVRAVAVESTRPRASSLLAGREPESAVQLVPLLFSVCGRAQQAAAMAAVAAAQDRELAEGAQLNYRVACEAMQEHLWRMLLDWPDALGLPQYRQQFVNWYAELNKIVAGQGDVQMLHGELYRVLLGMGEAEWRKVDTRAQLEAWWESGQGLLAPLLAALDRYESRLEFFGAGAACDWLPEWTASEAMQALAGCFDHEFAARPEFRGQPLETGALAYGQGAPLLRDVLRARPTRLLARLIARLLDLLDSADRLVREQTSGRVQQVAGDGAGLSLVRTARGTLLHRVCIEAGEVGDYLIVAPTEWNFHPQGALVSGLAGLQENDAARLAETVRRHVLSLDPCVEYEIGVNHA